MIATILDTHTGLCREIDEIDATKAVRSWHYATGNWSCDCNRHESDPDATEWTCEGHERYLVIAAVYLKSHDDQEYTLQELNADYPQQLLERYKLRPNDWIHHTRVYNNGDRHTEEGYAHRIDAVIGYSRIARGGCALFRNEICVQRGYLSADRCNAISLEIAAKLNLLQTAE